MLAMRVLAMGGFPMAVYSTKQYEKKSSEFIADFRLGLGLVSGRLPEREVSAPRAKFVSPLKRRTYATEHVMRNRGVATSWPVNSK